MSDDDFDSYIQEHKASAPDDFDSYIQDHAASPVSSDAPTKKTSALRAGLDGYANMATGGYLAHLQAVAPEVAESLARAVVPALPLGSVSGRIKNPNQGLDDSLRSQGFSVQNAPEKSYVDRRDENLQHMALEDAEHPIATKVGQGLGIAATALMPAGAMAKEATLGAKALSGAKSGFAIGAASNPGDTEGEIDPLQARSRLINGGIGSAIGAAVPAVTHTLGVGASKVGRYLRNKAETLAENATGATRVGAEKFKEGTGRHLLDNDIVTFGADPKKVAANANAAMDAAEVSKQGALTGDLSGARVDRNKVYNVIKAKIDSIKGDESQTGLVRQLEARLDDIVNAADHTGESELALGKSEDVRRGFDKNAKWDSASDAPTREANKIVANAYRDAGEEAATAASPDAGAIFQNAKKTQSTLIPVAEAAEKRALQLQQSPHGGLLDIAHAGAGGAIGSAFGPVGAVVGPAVALGAKALRPRYASMGAVSADGMSKFLAKAADAGINPKVAAAVVTRLAKGPPGTEKDPNPIIRDQEMMDMFQKNPQLLDFIKDDTTREKVKRAISGSMGRNKP